MTTVYETINVLPDMSFIGGTDKILEFTCYDDDGVTLLTITSGDVEWRLCPFGEFDVQTLEKTGTITTANKFTITLTAADTVNLSGKFIQQVFVTDFFGKTFVPGQGIVLISPAIASS